MVKNYKNFITENSNNIYFKKNIFTLDRAKFIFPDEDSLDGIDKIDLDLSNNLYDILLYTQDYNVDDNRIVNKEFKLLNNNLNINLNNYNNYFFIEKGSSDFYYIILNVVKDSIHYEIRITTKTFNDFIKKQDKRKTGDHEQYQILGFYINEQLVNEEIFDYDLKMSDFSPNNLNIKEELLNDNKNLILGSALFKKFLMNEFIYDEVFNTKTLKNKKPFYIKSVLHNKDLSSFLTILNKSENNKLSKDFFNYKQDYKNNKLNTADCVLCNFDFDSSYSSVIENSIILSSPTNNMNGKYIEYWDDVCYIIPSDIFLNALDNVLNKKEKEEFSFYFNERFEETYYFNIVNKIFKYLDINNNYYPAFVLVSLKKDRFNCQLGKSTLIFKQLLDDKQTVNEGFLSNVYDYVSNLFNRFVNFFNKIKDKQIFDIITDINNLKIDNVSESRITNSDYWWSDLKQNKIKKYGVKKNAMIVFSEIKYLSSTVEEQHLKYKMNATLTIDKYIDKLIKLLGTKFEDLEKFNKKMSTIMGNTLMGNTNLPIYMVYGYNDKDKNPVVTYSLHKMKSIKQQSQFDDLMNYKDFPYIINIKNFTDKDTNEIKYRSVDIFIFNYKNKNESVYYCLRLSTKSSSHDSFAVEATPVKEGFIASLKDKIRNL